MFKDFLFALRSLRSAPLFTLIAVLTLALGIGANTAIFSVLNGILLRPLPFENADELVFVEGESTQGYRVSVSIPNYRDWRERTRAFSESLLFRNVTMTLSGIDEPQRLVATEVMGEFFELAGRQAVAGRTLDAGELDRGAEHVAVLGHGLWQSRFGGDPEIVGRRIILDTVPYVVSGVMPADFFFPSPATDLYLPMGVDERLPWDDRGSSAGTYLVGRRKPGTDFAAAAADFERVAREMRAEHPTAAVPVVEDLRSRFFGPLRLGLFLLFGAVAFVLLIACANVANLLLSRSEMRTQEIALRSALGASRGQILRLLLTESWILAGGGALAGTLLAVVGLRLLKASLPSDTPFLERIVVDGRVLLFTLCLVLVTGVLFGLVPALQALRSDLRSPLQEGGNRSVGSGRGRLRAALVVSEVALALVLLAGATLMMRSLANLRATHPGFQSSGVVSMRITLPEQEYQEREAGLRLYDELLERVAARPAVQQAGYNSGVPLASGGTETQVVPDNRSLDRESFESCLYQMSSGSYFQTLGIPLLRGRTFDRRDRDGAPLVAIVDSSLAEAFWPDGDALGRRISLEEDDNEERIWRQVVGVVGHVRHYELRSKSRIQVYLPMHQPLVYIESAPELALFIRTSGEPEHIVPEVRAELTDLDPDLPLFNVSTMDEIVRDEVSTERLLSSNLLTFSAVALLLAAIGIYGVIAYTVSRRTREIGLRLALGAERGDVLRMIVARSLRLVFAGLALGLVLALAINRLLQSQLFEVGAADPIALAAITLLLLTVGGLASLLPALRASRTDPLEALRHE